MLARFLPHCDVLAGQVSSGDPQLSVPRPKRDVSVWDARDHAVILPWQSLMQVLRAVAWVDGSLEAYRAELRRLLFPCFVGAPKEKYK